MKTLRLALPFALGVLAVVLTAPANAGVDIDFGASVQLDDRTDVYFSISSHYFDRDRDTVTTWGARYRDPDDLAVALFIGRHSGRSLDDIYALRQRRGLTWWEISVQYGVPVEVWFVEVKRDPGPPYGNAYGHWKKHKHNRNTRVVLTDVDLRNLVAVRMVHEYYGVSVDVAMEWRSGGSDLRDLMANEYHNRHGKRHGGSKVATGAKSKPGKGNNGQGKNKKK
jgi:hypothetical protein